MENLEVNILMTLEHVHARVIKPLVDFGGLNQTDAILKEVVLSTEGSILS